MAHDALLCVQTGSQMDDPKRFKFEGNEHYLKSAAEMRRLFAEAPEACDNTLWIAERADVEIEFPVIPSSRSSTCPTGSSTQGQLPAPSHPGRGRTALRHPVARGRRRAPGL